MNSPLVGWDKRKGRELREVELHKSSSWGPKSDKRERKKIDAVKKESTSMLLLGTRKKRGKIVNGGSP